MNLWWYLRRIFPGKNCIALIGDDQPCLANDFVNHPEEPILLLAHPDRHLLPKAVEAVSIEYDPLPAIFTIEESERRAEIIWGEDNIFKTYLIEKGDVDGVWEKADYIVEGEYTTGAQEQLYIENNGMIAAFDAAGNHGVGLAAVSLLRSQALNGAVRLAGGESSRRAEWRLEALSAARKNIPR
jgi:CO/xanthine dehydrogenase Mo-binding subunit